VFGVQVDRSYSPSLWTTKKASVKGACLRHATRFKLLGPIHISGMAEARAHKFCTKGDYIKSCQRNDGL